jgi:hypothetical protein
MFSCSELKNLFVIKFYRMPPKRKAKSNGPKLPSSLQEQLEEVGIYLLITIQLSKIDIYTLYSN